MRCSVWAARAALRGEVAALVTAPLHKEALSAAGVDFPGHTELLQAEAAAHMADQRHAEVDDPVGDAADVHQVAGQDEAGHAQDDEGIDTGKHPFRQDAERNVGKQDVDE